MDLIICTLLATTGIVAALRAERLLRQIEKEER